MNVTLGVPRLRELLRVASTNDNAPMMEVPILRGASVLRKVKRLQRGWFRLLFSQVLSRGEVQEKLVLKLNDRTRAYVLEFHFDGNYSEKHCAEILRSFESTFFPCLCRSITKKRKELINSSDRLCSA